MNHRILIVHPDSSVRALMFSMLQSLGYKFEEAESDRAAVRMLDHSPFQLVLASAAEDPSDALELATYIRRRHPQTRVLLFSPTPRPELARECSLRGALGCLRFPIAANQLRAAVAQALPEPQHVAEGGNGSSAGVTHFTAWNAADHVADSGSSFGSACPNSALIPHLTNGEQPRINGRANGNGTLAEPVCEDSTIRKILDLAEALAPKKLPLLIVGEKGSGRKYLARTMHLKSPWRDGPFLVVSCAPAPEIDLESLLFGRYDVEHGVEEPGLFARAAGGTLLLDDLQDLSPTLQTQLLQVIRDGEYRPIGSDRVHRVECRLVLGSCEELGTLVERGTFRSDLFYALSAVTLKLPPLRHRGQDILRLAEHFRDRFARQTGKSVVGISSEAGRRLASHDWPNNIAELKAVIERAVARCRGHWIEPNHLDLDSKEHLESLRRGSSHVAAGRERESILPLKEALQEPEKKLILEALRALNWNRQETARVLDINRTTLYKKMKKYGLIFEEPVWTN